MIALDTIPELIIAALSLIASVALIVLPVVSFLRWFFSRGGRASLKGASASIGEDQAGPILEKLKEMDDQRSAAQVQTIERERLNQKQWKRTFTILGCIVTAMHEYGIGNGSLKAAEDVISECEDARDDALVGQMGG